MTTCPNCGQPMLGNQIDRLRDLLRSGQRHRHVYMAQSGGWYVNHGGGPVPFEAVQALLQQGEIARVYDDCAEAYHIGKTINMAATLEYRKGKKRKDWRSVYTDGSISA